jgi:hypothetical protein
MRTEGDIHQRLAASEAELSLLCNEIALLTREVQQGNQGWHTALERLAADYQQRRALLAQQEVLRWVLRAEHSVASDVSQARAVPLPGAAQERGGDAFHARSA